MNVAVIFAGGVGSRMNSKAKPKQFLELPRKPMIVYTIELLENHPQIGGIIISCVEEWIDYLKDVLFKLHLKKWWRLLPAGKQGSFQFLKD